MIYFVRAVDEIGPIKIGTTIRLSARLKQLESEYGVPLHLLGVLPGSFAEERALHDKFSHLQADGEWFLWAPELMDFIARECSPWDGVDEVPLSALGKPVKIDKGVVTKAKLVAGTKGILLAEYLSESLRTVVDRDFSKAVRSIEGGDTKH